VGWIRQGRPQPLHASGINAVIVGENDGHKKFLKNFSPI